MSAESTHVATLVVSQGTLTTRTADRMSLVHPGGPEGTLHVGTSTSMQAEILRKPTKSSPFSPKERQASCGDELVRRTAGEGLKPVSKHEEATAQVGSATTLRMGGERGEPTE